MRKIRLTVIITALALMLASCSVPAAQTGESAKPGFSENDLVFVYNGAQFPLCSDVAPLLEALGSGYKMTAAESCVYKGDDKWFYYPDEEMPDIMVATNPIEGKDVFYLIEIYGEDYATSKGIKVGSTLDEVKAAYGGGGFELDGAYVYFLSGDSEDIKSRQLSFEHDEAGVVTVISYWDPSTNIK